MRTPPGGPETFPGAGVAMPETVTSPALRTLVAAVEAYRTSGGPASDAEVGGDLLAVGVLIERLEAARVELLSELDRSGAYLAEGAVSAGGRLRARTGMGRGAARERVVLARRLPEMPATTRAFAAGEISHQHASVLAAALAPDTDPYAREQFLAAESDFVEAARLTTPQELRKIIERYVLDLAGDDGTARADALHARRRLHASTTYEGMVAGSFLFDAESGEILLTALAARMSADPDDPDGPPRTPAQHRADALTDVMRDFLDAGVPVTTGGERPHVTVLVDLMTLRGHNPDSPDHRPHPDDCPVCTPLAEHFPGFDRTARIPGLDPDDHPDCADPDDRSGDHPDCSDPDDRSGDHPDCSDPDNCSDDHPASTPGATAGIADRNDPGPDLAAPSWHVTRSPDADPRQHRQPEPDTAGCTAPANRDPRQQRQPKPDTVGCTAPANRDPRQHRQPEPDTVGCIAPANRDARRHRRCDLSGSALLARLRADMPPPEVMLRSDPASIERRCELEHLGPICAETARRLACDSSISRIVVAGSSEPLDVGRRTRTIPSAMRRAVIYRDRHCQYPGCDQRARFCDVHHCDEWWADHGSTDAKRLVLLCRRHHRMTHEGHQRISRDDAGRIHVTRADGSEVPDPLGAYRPPDRTEPDPACASLPPDRTEPDPAYA